MLLTDLGRGGGDGLVRGSSGERLARSKGRTSGSLRRASVASLSVAGVLVSLSRAGLLVVHTVRSGGVPAVGPPGAQAGEFTRVNI